MFFPTCATHQAASSSLPSARLRPPAVASCFPTPAPLPTSLTRRTLMPNRPTLPADRFGSLPSGHTTPPYRLRAAFPGGHAARPEPCTADFNRAVGAGNAAARPTDQARGRATHLPCVPRPPPSQPSRSSAPPRPTGRRRVPSRSVTPRRPIVCAPPRPGGHAARHETCTADFSRAVRPGNAAARPTDHARGRATHLPCLPRPPPQPALMFIYTFTTHRAASSALQIGHTTPPDPSRAAFPGGHAARPEPCPADFNRAVGAGNATAKPTGDARHRSTRLSCVPRPPPSQPSCSSTPSTPTGRRRVPSRSVTPRRPTRCAPPSLAVTPRATKHAPPTSAKRSARAIRPQAPPTMLEAVQLTCHASRDPRPASPHVHPHLCDPPGGVECPPDRSHHAALSVARRLPWRSRRAPRKQLPTLTGCP